MKHVAFGLAAMLASYPVIPPAIAAEGAAADFFKSKQMQIIVGYGAGGGYDVYARLVAKHLSTHLPGQPSVIVQNMPGAGSLRAANYIYNAAPKDGSFLATFARSMVMMGMLGGNPNVQFDARKFTWLGSPSSAQDEAYMLWVRKDAKAKTLEDARRPGGPEILLGGSSEGSTDTDIAVLIRNAAGVRLKVIGGYPDSNAMYLAVERGEVEGRFVGTSALSSTRPDWLKPDGPMIPLLQFARATRLPEFADVPTAREVARDDRARELIEMAEIPYMLSRPYVGPPDIPADRAHILQDAFLDMGKDPAFLADAKKMRVDVSPVGAKEATRMLDMLANAPQDMKDELRKMQSGG